MLVKIEIEDCSVVAASLVVDVAFFLPEVVVCFLEVVVGFLEVVVCSLEVVVCFAEDCMCLLDVVVCFAFVVVSRALAASTTHVQALRTVFADMLGKGEPARDLPLVSLRLGPVKIPMQLTWQGRTCKKAVALSSRLL